MTSVKVAQHAAGIGSPTLKGAGLLSFVKYDNRGISVAITAALLATIIQGFVNTYGSSF